MPARPRYESLMLTPGVPHTPVMLTVLAFTTFLQSCLIRGRWVKFRFFTGFLQPCSGRLLWPGAGRLVLAGLDRLVVASLVAWLASWRSPPVLDGWIAWSALAGWPPPVLAGLLAWPRPHRPPGWPRMASGWPWLAGWWSGSPGGLQRRQRGRKEAKTKGEGEGVGHRWPLDGRRKAGRRQDEAKHGLRAIWSQDGREMVQEGKQERPPFAWWPVGRSK